MTSRPRGGLWTYVLGYGAAYVPYSLLAKGISKGLFSADRHGLDGPVLLPISMIFSVVAMFAFWWRAGWWQDAARARPWRLGRVTLPRPRAGTWLAGVCVAGISASTTLAFTFDGVSIVLALLLMRGGILVMAPVIDALQGRGIRPRAWLGFGLTLAALLLSLRGNTGGGIPRGCALVLAVYFISYFARFWLMTRLAKSPDHLTNRRFLIEEQMVGNGLLVVGILTLAAWPGGAGAAGELRRGLLGLWGDAGLCAALLAMGLCSAGTGMFGTLVFLDRRENTFCVPLNRAASLLAGVLAALLLGAFFGTGAPRSSELLGVGLVVAALAVAAWPGRRVAG